MNKIYLHFYINSDNMFAPCNSDALLIMNLIYGASEGDNWNHLPIEKIKMLREFGYVVYTRAAGEPLSKAKEYKV